MNTTAIMKTTATFRRVPGQPGVLRLCTWMLVLLASGGLSLPQRALAESRSPFISPIVLPENVQRLALVDATVQLPGGRLMPHQTVLIDGPIITAVGSGLSVPAGYTSLDASGRVLTPGLIDAFTQVGLVEISAEQASNDTNAKDLPFVPALRVESAFNPRSMVIPITREAGVTSVVVMPSDGILCGQAAWAELGEGNAEALLLRPVMASHLRIEVGAFEQTLASRSALWMQLEAIFSDARALLKDPGYLARPVRPESLPPAQLRALQPVLRGELPLVVTVHRASDIELLLRFAAREKLKVVVAGGMEAWLVRDALASARVPVILNPMQNLPDRFEGLLARSDAAALLEQAGVTVLTSTFSSHGPRNLRQVAGNALRFGMSEAAALRSMTEAPAQVFGMPELGSIRPGARADLVLWTESPLELASQPLLVLVGGRQHSPLTHQRALLERYRQAPPVPAGQR